MKCAITLNHDDPEGNVKEIAQDIACDLTLKYGILVSPRVADKDYIARHQGWALLEAVEEEGIPL